MTSEQYDIEKHNANISENAGREISYLRTAKP
jgi:hypothetical protein